MAIQFTAGKIEPPKEFYVPAGRYHLRVIEAKEDTHTDSSDIMKVTFRTVKNGVDGPAFKETFFFTAKALWKADTFLKACGKHPGEGNPVSLDPAELVGWECEAELKVREFVGNKGDKIKTNEVSFFVCADEDDFS